MDRRGFIHATGVALAAFAPSAVAVAQELSKAAPGRPADSVAVDEDFWFTVRHAFTVDRNIINLNNGGVSPCPKIVLDTQQRYNEVSNMGPAHFMWNVLGSEVETVRSRLARQFGCDPEEIAITRNASEALETVQLGLDLKRGDEVLTTTQDYPRMLTTWRQRERRDGLVLRQIQFPVPPPSLDDLYTRVTSAVGPQTKVIHLCHITNLTGQIFPIKRICQWARPRNIEVIVDGAHAFAQFPYTRDDLDCDYYGTSLHKWLLAPIGTGFLYVRREKIPKVWPLMAAPDSMTANIRKFEEIGTHPASLRNSITEAVIFHESIGPERKAARFRYLRKRWTTALRGLPNVKMLTSDDPEMSCGIGLLHVDGLEPGPLAAHLMDKYKILVVPITVPGEYNGLRITPNVYTTVGEIDIFSEVMSNIVRKGALV